MNKGMIFAGVMCLMVCRVLATDIGDQASELKIATWVKGQSVSLSACKGTNIVVLEFWATWCPPCWASIPHLTELQREFKDKGVIIVGVSIENEETIKKFVEEMGDKMAYTVAVDKENATTASYLQAFNIPRLLPYAFVIDKESKIIWHGHPMQGLDDVLAQVLEGKYNSGAFKKKNEAGDKLKELVTLIAANGDEKEVERIAKEIETIEKEVGHIMPENKKFSLADIKKSMKFNELAQEYAKAVVADLEPAKIEEIAEKVKAAAPEDFRHEMMETIYVQILMQQYVMVVTQPGEKKQVARLAERIGSARCKDAEMMSNFAWFILTDKRVVNRDLKLALALAKSAVEITGEKDSACLAAYAKALFENKSITEAIEYKKKAIAMGKNAKEISELEKLLQEYEAGAKTESVKIDKDAPARFEAKEPEASKVSATK